MKFPAKCKRQTDGGSGCVIAKENICAASCVVRSAQHPLRAIDCSCPSTCDASCNLQSCTVVSRGHSCHHLLPNLFFPPVCLVVTFVNLSAHTSYKQIFVVVQESRVMVNNCYFVLLCAISTTQGMWDLFSGLSWTSCLMLLWSLLFLCKVLLVCFVLLVLTLFPHNRMWNFSKAGFTSDSTLYLAFSNLLLLFVNLQVYWLFQKLKLSSKPHHSPLILESGEKWIVMTWLALLVEVANIPAETSNPVQ